jgi:ectoine hydroxylase-related dioxygenase (phytanoyl-CoA dioxygenase family)
MNVNANAASSEEINRLLYPLHEIYSAIQGPDDIQVEHAKLYKEQGFLAVESILSDTEIRGAIEAIMEHIFSDETNVKIQFSKPKSELTRAEDREFAVRKLYEFAEVEQRLRAIAYHPVLLNIVERLIGAKPRLVQDMALLKPPNGGGEKPWHQDMAYGNLAYDQSVIGVWIALDEVGIDNGCMQVVPRSHMDGGTPHYAIRDWQICDANVPVQRNVAVPLKPGGALFFHGLLVHGTANNFSNKRRRALQFHYVSEKAEKVSPREYKRMFTNEMTGAEC